ncbi:MAG: HPr(Ser) kinase/phosphatase [Acholeplasmatales bacterium]|nr:HPr(Ser) kinase/phosphatase [Acholeplasmatales bacterium]
MNVNKLVKDLNLTVLAGENGLNRKITDDNVTRPGLELAGFFDFFEPKRILLMGSKEASFLSHVELEISRDRIRRIFKTNPPCLICSLNVQVPGYLIELGNELGTPILKSNLRTTAISSKLYNYLQLKLAPIQTVHGVLMDINGMGTLIMGKSGIGKSETAMELIKRGHQLISDDRVDVIEKEPGYLIGRAPKVLEHYIELRGIGIVDVVNLYGAGAFRESKKIRLVVEFETWEEGKYYDRLGIESQTMRFFNTDVHKVVIPVLPGRNLALLVESAALNEKMKYFGINSALNFTQAINKMAEAGEREDEEE